MIRESYAVWNNKGGVGKSTLTFHLATTYASQHPKERVLVVDMCPQANCTMMLLGSGTKGEDCLIALETQSPAPTIAGYIDERINRLAGTRTGASETTRWMHQVSTKNSALPSNLYLVAGDGNLELLAAPVAYFANAQFPAGVWGAVHKWVADLISTLTADNQEQWTVFVDTNPSFSVYTELAMIATKKLLVPFNADDSSRHAVGAIFRLLYGVGKANPLYDKFTFRHQTTSNNLPPPRCRPFIGNRFTQHKGAAAAFSALSDAVCTELWSTFQSWPQHFTPRIKTPKTQPTFEIAYSTEVRDFNTAGVVSAHLGVLLRNLSGGTYQVHGDDVQVNSTRVSECAGSIDAVVKHL